MSQQILEKLGLKNVNSGSHGKQVYSEASSQLDSISPINGEKIAAVTTTTEKTYEAIVNDASETFREWRRVPAPERGELVRLVGNAFRDLKKELGYLVTWETGKILAEGEGEVQEAIDIADFAVGLSRQLYGLTMHSERPSHRMYEQWHPLGIVGVISAFNFPAAVWAWNSMLAAVCGDVTIWKPSEHTPLTAVAMNLIARKVAEERGFPGLFNLIIGDGPDIGKKLAADHRIPLISATGSCRMGRAVGEVVAKRFGKTILELGGNNAVIVLKDADLNLVVRSTAFGAVGTAGQRCTSTRRLLVEKPIFDDVVNGLKKIYAQVKIGDPRESGTLMGPLINSTAVAAYEKALAHAKEQGGEILCGGQKLTSMPSSMYVAPTIVKARAEMAIVKEETFAPILYVIPINGLDEAIQIQNDVPQGLSSAIFTQNLRAAEKFLSAEGSDCGIANVNLGTSGAEIGGAFGGEKETGGGRESGSDSWRQYMRRQTNTINHGDKLPLAQGIKFEV